MSDISIDSNIDQAMREISVLASRIPAAVDAGTKAVATHVLLKTTQAMEEEIYNQPLPPSYREYGLSERTGALLAGEGVLVLAESEYLIATENTGLADKDPTRYAEWRHGYEKLPAPWRDVGEEEALADVPAVFETAFNEGLAFV